MTDTIDVLITVPISEDIVKQLEAISSDIRIRLHPAEKERDIPNRAWQNAEVVLANFFLPPTTLNTRIKWVHSIFSGVDNLLEHPYLQNHPEVILSNSGGIHAAKIGEFVIGMILALGHRLPGMFMAQQKKEWPNDKFSRFMAKELNESTVGILGYGRIGREIARLCKSFGATVLATKRNVRHPEDRRYTLPGTGDPEGDLADRLYPPEATAFMVKECDFVVITLPLTDNTKMLFDEKIIHAMKPESFLINVGRGGIVDEAALAEALNAGRIGGAASDVFASEPLPASSPLWTAKNFILSPHISGNMRDYTQKASAIFEENLRRYIDNKPLMNVINRELGY